MKGYFFAVTAKVRQCRMEKFFSSMIKFKLLSVKYLLIVVKLTHFYLNVKPKPLLSVLK